MREDSKHRYWNRKLSQRLRKFLSVFFCFHCARLISLSRELRARFWPHVQYHTKRKINCIARAGDLWSFTRKFCWRRAVNSAAIEINNSFFFTRIDCLFFRFLCFSAWPRVFHGDKVFVVWARSVLATTPETWDTTHGCCSHSEKVN